MRKILMISTAGITSILLIVSIPFLAEKPSPQVLTIFLEKAALEQLTKQRNEALEHGFILTEFKKDVPAIVQVDGDKPLRAEVQLKGDLPDHIEGDKWSLTVTLTEGKTVKLPRVFSIMHPARRNYLYEWLLHKTYEEAGGNALGYSFVQVTINGANMGLYALKENSKNLSVLPDRATRAVVKFSDKLVWKMEDEKARGNSTRNWNTFNQYREAPIESLVLPEVEQDPSWQEQNAYARTLLEKYQRGEVTPEEVFDMRKWALHVAVADLLGAHHMLQWFNLRFLLNPDTHLLEPIAYDGDAGKNFGQMALRRYEVHLEFWKPFFQNEEFLAEYYEALDRLSDPAFLDRVLVKGKEERERYERAIEREFPDAHFFPSIIYENQQMMQRYLQGRGKKEREQTFVYTGLPLLNANALNMDQGNRDYSFLLAGHIYGSRDETQEHPAQTFVRNTLMLQKLDPAFMVILGDIIFKDPTTESIAIDKKIGGGLPFPLLHVIGNHDSFYQKQYQETGKRTWRSFRSGTDLFIILDSEIDDGVITGHQMEFLQAQIARFREVENLKNLFIFSHRLVWAIEHPRLAPLLKYVNGPNHHIGREGTIVHKVLPLLTDLKEKNVYFVSGDIGHSYSFPLFYEKDLRENITYIATGIGDTEKDAILQVHINEKGIVQFTPISLTGKQMAPIETYRLAYWEKYFAGKKDQ